MAKLAIKGHATRGKEVIEVLEMLGGRNDCNYEGGVTRYIYKIDGKRTINWYISHSDSSLAIFTLEEFLEKFPYKVGDKVNSPCKGCIKTITSMEWDTYLNTVTYKLDNRVYTNIDLLKVVNDLQPYRTISIDDFKANTKEWLIDKLESMSKDDALQTICNIHDELHKHPKTYEECCKVLFPSSIELGKVLASGYNCEKLKKFGELLICRDAYWQIAGEQMGLGKPWEPDWENFDSMKYCIGTDKRIVGRCTRATHNRILSFPTEEMRDEFLENFRELINQCKELL